MSEFRKTCQRWNDVGHAHALTFSCFRRQPLLSREQPCERMIDAIERTRQRHPIHLWAYVLMPEHVHLLVWPTMPDYSISSILKTLKQSVAWRVLNDIRKRSPALLAQIEERQPDGTSCHRIWQRGGGFDRNLMEPAAVWAYIDYIHANPVRRGLCVHPIDWKWSSAREWESPGSGMLRVDRESLPRTIAG